MTVSLDPSTNGKALLLTTGTEVSIAPKTRGKPNGAGSTTAKQEKLDTVESKQQGLETYKKPSRALRVLPSRTISPFRPSCPALQDGAITAIAFVSRVLLNSVAGQPLYAKPSSWIASIQRLPPPVDPSGDSNTPTLVAPPPPPQPRVLVTQEHVPSKPTSSTVTDGDEEGLREEVLVVWSPHVSVPDGHVVFHGSIGQVEDFDHVK